MSTTLPAPCAFRLSSFDLAQRLTISLAPSSWTATRVQLVQSSAGNTCKLGLRDASCIEGEQRNRVTLATYEHTDGPRSCDAGLAGHPSATSACSINASRSPVSQMAVSSPAPRFALPPLPQLVVSTFFKLSNDVATSARDLGQPHCSDRRRQHPDPHAPPSLPPSPHSPLLDWLENTLR